MARRVLLLANGEPPSRRLVRGLARRAELIVAADGGANTARACGVRPDVIIGDLDSALPSTLLHFRKSRVIPVARQDNTDLEKALDFLVAEGEKEAVVLGATGGRLDFTLANIAVFWKYSGKLRLTFRGDGWTALPVGARLERSAARGATASLIPFGRCAGITLRGFQYPLTNAAMRPGEIGVSNVVVASSISVRVRTGNMLLVLYDGTAAARRAIRW